MTQDPTNRRACPVCASWTANSLFSVREDRFGEDWRGDLVECEDCGCCFLATAPNAEELSAFYRRCYGRYETLLAPVAMPHAWLLERLGVGQLLRRGEPSLVSTRGVRGPRVLDFGCHDGILLQALARQGHEVYGYEPYPTTDNIPPNILTGTLDNLVATIAPVDDIVLSHVLEHLLEPRETLCRLLRLLRPGGRVHLRVPNLASSWRKLVGPAWIHWHPPFHLQHFAVEQLDRLMTPLGFERVATSKFTPTDWVVGNLRAWLLPKPPLPNKRFHKPYPAEIYLAGRLLSLMADCIGGGDLLETVYQLSTAAAETDQRRRHTGLRTVERVKLMGRRTPVTPSGRELSHL